MKKDRIFKISTCLILFIVVSLLIGCNDTSVSPQPIKPEPIAIKEEPATATMPLSQSYTTEPKVALTFNGLADETTMLEFIRKLNDLNVHASFFIPGIKAATEPEVIQSLIDAGHDIQNNTLNQVLVNDLSYEKLYEELYLTNNLLEEQFGIRPTYVRSRSGDTSEAFNLAATALEQTVVTSTINPNDNQLQSAEDIANYVNQFLSRGKIILLNTYINHNIVEALPLINEYAEAKGLSLVSLPELMASSLPFSTDVPNNRLVEQAVDDSIYPNVIERFETTDKALSLTFDGWATDQTITELLDILDTYNVKATFFLSSKGPEVEPQLARLIYERGHHIANTSYSRTVVTNLSAEALQQDIIKNDQLLASAIQATPKNYYRPPQGVITTEAAKIIQATGVDYIIRYDVASWDWNKTISTEDVFNRVVEQAEPGSILSLSLMDDTHTLIVLPQIIEHYLTNDYDFLLLEEMIDRYVEEGDSNE